MQFALVHSPLVGPSTWRWTADALGSEGHDVVVPDLRDAVVGGHPDAVIAAAVAAVPASWSNLVLAGHSGAGSFLPSIANRPGGRVTHLVFVDAGIPPLEGTTTPGGDFLGGLRALAVEGILPRWSAWWGEGVMEGLVSDPDRRRELEAEMPEIPLAFFESSIGVPATWTDTPAAFLLLSDPYRDAAERARRLGWPVIERLGGHLDIVNHPHDVARAIVDLAN